MAYRPAYVRKTRDTWEFWVNYGQGWEHEHTDLTRAEMRENRKAYRGNCAYPLKIVKRRVPLHVLYECGICGAYHPWAWSGDCETIEGGEDDQVREDEPGVV